MGNYRSFEKDYILKNSLSKNELIFSGIYFLISDKEIVYVGKSKDVACRINNHKKEDVKKFDNVFFIKVPEKELESTENYYISKFKPKYNKSCVGIVKINRIRDRVRRLLKDKNSLKSIPNMPNYIKENYCTSNINNSCYASEEVIFITADFLNKKVNE